VRIHGYLEAADTAATLAAVHEVGAIVEHRPDELLVRGCGLYGAQAPPGAIDVGNAGTLIRVLPGWLAGQPGLSFELDGDDSIRRRPVDRIAEPLTRMGAHIDAREGRYPPFTVHGAALQGIAYELPVASAQVKSCVLLAGLATDSTTVVERVPSRDHTERMLLRAGASIAREGSPEEGYRTTVGRADELEIESIDVPGDLSSAAFLIAAGVLVDDSRLVLERVGVNWTRAGFLRILERMGAIVLSDVELAGEFGPQEPISDLDVRSAPIEATTVEPREIPLAIDELPLVALLGCFAEGQTVVRGASELRIKESDRIATVVEGLRGLGADIEATEDGFAVRGTGRLRGGRLDARGDHRLALLGAVAGLASEEGVEVVGMEAAAVSYPRFADDVAQLTR
jgi:3-phosphoshikimate 1-carboxyvinyltransferase